MQSDNRFFRTFLLAAALAVCSAHQAQADTIYNATGGTENGGDPLSTTSGAGPILADRFVSSTGGSLTSVTLNLSLPSGASAGAVFSVDLFADAGASGPGAVLFQIATVADSSLTNAFSLETYLASRSYTLTYGQSYYVGVLDGGSNAVLGNTLDPTVLGRSSVAAGASYYNNGGVQANAGGPYEIAVNAAPVPEPAPVALVLSGVALLGGGYRKVLGRLR